MQSSTPDTGSKQQISPDDAFLAELRVNVKRIFTDAQVAEIFKDIGVIGDGSILVTDAETDGRIILTAYRLPSGAIIWAE